MEPCPQAPQQWMSEMGKMTTAFPTQTAAVLLVLHMLLTVCGTTLLAKKELSQKLRLE
jgi:hypothetical protein